MLSPYVYLTEKVELVGMGGAPGLGSGVLMLEWSPDEEGVVPPGSVADACKEIGSCSPGCGLFLGTSNDVVAGSTGRELGSYDASRVDPTERELGDIDNTVS
ncbi:hypothetical protein B296_00055247 [Ensete ventricosum]|uniref:Uncharacterized protein n=1 Tax=Ensete ventricosum TaxID=4639 RepID=A0A426XBL2_ENSVE|nr:hypothetical protein B296_00055247 [Ensete ventricosum]